MAATATATAAPLFTTMNSSVPRSEPTVTLAEMRRRTHFERLCVPPNCTRKDVVAAYRRFALVYHPDKNRHEDAAEIFKLLGESHKAIVNDEARIAYQIQLQQSSRGNPYTPDPRISNAEAALKRAFTSSGAHMWGRANAGAATKAQPPKKPKPNPQRYIVPIDLEAMDAGKKIPYDYKKITTGLHGDTERLLTAIIDVPLGATDGEKITLENQGNCYFGMSAADLVFLLQQKPHPLFTRRIGADLFIERRVDPLEMLTGVAFEFKTVYGEIVEAHCEPPLSQNQMIRIPGVGMRKRGLAHGGPDDERGDVVVCIRVVVADAAKLSREDVEGIQRIIKKRKPYFYIFFNTVHLHQK
jgi:DnaJ-class molecular chaperone